MREITIILNNKKMQYDSNIGETTKIHLPEGWNFLESEFSAKLETMSFYKWFWAQPGDLKPSRVIVVTGEWNPRAEMSNRYFVRGSRHTTQENLFKFMKFDAVENKVLEIMNETDEKFVKLYKDWKDKYNFNEFKTPVYAEDEPIWV